MLSMLRYMADTGDSRKVTLIWSNRTEADILCREEIEGMKEKLPNFAVHHVLTQQKDFGGHTGRLTAETLEKLLSACRPGSLRFRLWSAAHRTDATCRSLKGLEFKGSHIYKEKFSY